MHHWLGWGVESEFVFVCIPPPTFYSDDDDDDDDDEERVGFTGEFLGRAGDRWEEMVTSTNRIIDLDAFYFFH
jgi:hypothetical protein